MTEPVRTHSIRQLARNDQENIPVLLAQELLRIFVADACLGFSKAWNPIPRSLMADRRSLASY